ncbi:hypothetical protein BAE44_0020601, partial [Dichanthelium oligosanthes]
LKWLMMAMVNSRQFKVSDWFLNRRKDYKDGRFSKVVIDTHDVKLGDDLERLRKTRVD